MVVALALLVGCGPDPVRGGPSPSDTADTGSPGGSTPTLPEHGGVVEGSATFVDGGPLAGLRVTLCGGICQVGDVGADGSFRFEGVWPQVNVLESVDYPGEDQAEASLHWARFFDLLTLGVDELVLLDRPLRMHPVAPVRGLSGAQDLEVAPGLRVAFDADRIGVDHPLPFPTEEVALGAVELPPEDWPRGLGGWTAVRAWAFAPWDLAIDDGFAATATLSEPLPEGVEAAFLVADYLTGFRDGTLEVEPAEVSPDRLEVRTPAGDGLNRTTLWVLATRTP